MPTTTDRCTCPTAPAVCDGPQPDCPVHGYADAIMSAGRYVDRRGRRWTETEPHGMWFDWEAIMRIDHSRMRLLIVRDLHREIGCSPRDCKFHPVPVVAKVWGDGWFASRPGCRNEEIYPTLAEAFAAAERLATGEKR